MTKYKYKKYDPATGDYPTIRSYQVKNDLKVRSGIIGKQVENGKVLPGGGHQYEFIDDIRKNWVKFLDPIDPIGIKLTP